ncbi:sensor histidine kinase [Nocardioides aequoreus]|uniref:sensor histidine kinase n=1 Tax=Nocardioides aequoreus TaxID=397278 RepID=UPI0004C2BF22|nr:HAMP domain-containing sensor histidine kinase [Nocardioides aequoreus]
MTGAQLETRAIAVSTGGGRMLADQLLDSLQLIADGIVAVAGFGVAAIRIRRGEELELIVDTELPEEVGSRIPLALMLEELAVAETWGALRFVPHELSGGKELGWVVPDYPVADAPDAWHPMDMLVAPLYDAEGELRGTLAIDSPHDGRRPGLEARRVLERFAELASRAVLTALERESLAEQVAMAETVKSIVRSTSAQLSLEGLLQASERTLLEGFDAQQLWIKTVDEEQGVAEYLPEALRLALPPEIVDFAQRAAHYCWHQQTVMIVGTHEPVPTKMSQDHHDHVVRLLVQMGMQSLVFVPLGAGPECMGSLVLVRGPQARAWTDIECAALLDIGHDLGRAALNARTFEREHALVTELKALDEYKSQLISTVSHELKSPLTTVQGHLEMLTTGEIVVSDDARGSLTAIGRASQRMSRVIEDLLFLRQLDPARPLSPSAVDLAELVAEAMAMSSTAIVAKGLRVTFEAPEVPVLALGEPDELDKIVHNLMTNAVKYTPEHRAIDIALTDQGGTVALTVRDEGLGISEEDQAGLFTEFFRSTNPLAVAQPGTGLGLTIVRRIVDRHGGSISLDSALGEGSTFVVTLPSAA